MPKVATTIGYFDFFPQLKSEFENAYPGTKFSSPGSILQGDDLVEGDFSIFAPRRRG